MASGLVPITTQTFFTLVPISDMDVLLSQLALECAAPVT